MRRSRIRSYTALHDYKHSSHTKCQLFLYWNVTNNFLHTNVINPSTYFMDQEKCNATMKVNHIIYILYGKELFLDNNKNKILRQYASILLFS